MGSVKAVFGERLDPDGGKVQYIEAMKNTVVVNEKVV